MHDTTYYEACLEPILIGFILVITLLSVLIPSFWFQYKNRKRELGVPDNYNFKDHLIWLFEGLLGDIWNFLRVILIIAAIVLGLVLIYLLWSAVASGIEQMSVKDVLVIIAVLLVFILLKDAR